MILLIDNYDSFVHNLARYLARLGAATRVVRNDAITPDEVARLRPQAVVLSPGPCTPNEAGCSLAVVRELHQHFPMLGVCLGHQAIAQALGGRVVRGERPWHGRSVVIEHDGTDLFAGVPSPLEVGRYHSLVADPGTLPAKLRPTAWTADGTLMAFTHRTLPLFGLQFHPESILTQHGYTMLANFLGIAGVSVDRDPAELASGEYLMPAVPPLPAQRGHPLTF